MPMYAERNIHTLNHRKKSLFRVYGEVVRHPGADGSINADVSMSERRLVESAYEMTTCLGWGHTHQVS